MRRRPFRISRELTMAFRSRGYVCLRDFFPPEAVEELRRTSDHLSSRAGAILEGCRAGGISLSEWARDNPTDLIVVPEVGSPTQVCRYEFMIGSDLRFRNFVTHHVEQVVAALVGEKVTAFKDKTNEKLPGGGAFRPHQDFAAYREFVPRYHATTMLTIHPATAVNGCLQFASNFAEVTAGQPNHVLELVGDWPLLQFKDGGTGNGDLPADLTEQLQWESVPTNPSDLVVFDSFIPHHSEINRSGAPRRAIFVTFNRASEGSFYGEYYSEKRANYDHPKFHVSTPTSHRAMADPG